jgi:hypothetical protein
MLPIFLRLPITSLVLLLLLSGCSSYKLETLEGFPLPDAEEWDMGYRAQDEKEAEFKFVRFNETIRTWWDLITVIKRHAKREQPKLSDIQAELIHILKASTPYNVKVKLYVKQTNEIFYRVTIKDEKRIWEQSFTRILPGKKCVWIIQYSTKKTPMVDVREQAIKKYLKGIVWDK